MALSDKLCRRGARPQPVQLHPQQRGNRSGLEPPFTLALSGCVKRRLLVTGCFASAYVPWLLRRVYGQREEEGRQV